MGIFFPLTSPVLNVCTVAVSYFMTVYPRITLNIYVQASTSLVKLLPYIRIANHTQKIHNLYLEETVGKGKKY